MIDSQALKTIAIIAFTHSPELDGKTCLLKTYLSHMKKPNFIPAC